MEVHHHPHVTKKGFKEYFLEFIMIFLAVTMGFIAENIREHIADRAKEKEYVKSLLADLKNDTVELNRKYKLFSAFPPALNQLAADCYSSGFTDAIQKRMYSSNMRYLGTMQIYFTDKTAAQLKNGGGMRLINDAEVSDSITLYWQGVDDVNFTNANYENYRRELRQLSFRIFNYNFYKPYNNTSENNVGFFTGNPQLVTKDASLLKEYGSGVSLIANNIIIYYLPAIAKQKQMAVDLIRLLKEKYRLKNK
jgi:hypothetical protein